jgi:hypothetical protein
MMEPIAVQWFFRFVASQQKESMTQRKQFPDLKGNEQHVSTSIQSCKANYLAGCSHVFGRVETQPTPFPHVPPTNELHWNQKSGTRQLSGFLFIQSESRILAISSKNL